MYLKVRPIDMDTIDALMSCLPWSKAFWCPIKLYVEVPVISLCYHVLLHNFLLTFSFGEVQNTGPPYDVLELACNICLGH